MDYINRLAKDAQSSVESLVSAPKLTLYYFDIQGPAEPARLALTIGGIEFTDKRVWFSVETGRGDGVPADATPSERFRGRWRSGRHDISTHRSRSTR